MPPLTKPRATVIHRSRAALYTNSQVTMPNSASTESNEKNHQPPAPMPNSAPGLTLVSMPNRPSTIHHSLPGRGSPRQRKTACLVHKSTPHPAIARPKKIKYRLKGSAGSDSCRGWSRGKDLSRAALSADDFIGALDTV